jgi:hypothetical protein
MKIRPVGAELFHADGRTDGHDEAKSRFTQCAKVSYDMILKFIANIGNKYSVGYLVIIMKLFSDER